MTVRKECSSLCRQNLIFCRQHIFPKNRTSIHFTSFSPLQPHLTNLSLSATLTSIWTILLTISPHSFCQIYFLSTSTPQLSYLDKNHILDLVITSADTSLAPAVSFTHWSPSDHFPVFTRLSINPTPLPTPTLHSFRRFHSIDIGLFLKDLKSFQLLIVFFPKSLGPLLIASNTTLSSLLDKHALIVNKLSRRHADCSLHRTLGFLVLPPSVHFDPPSAMLKTSGNVLSLLLTGPPSSLSATNTTSSSSCLPKKSTKCSSLVSSASDNPKLALHSQTTSLLFFTGKILTLRFLPATLLHHLRIHPLLLPLSRISQFSLMPPGIRNPQDPVQLPKYRSCPTVQTSNLTQIRFQPGFSKNVHSYLLQQSPIVNLFLTSGQFHSTIKELLISVICRK